MAESGPGDSRSIENPTDRSDMPDELEEAVRSDVGEQPVSGTDPDAAGTPGERVTQPGEGLVTEEGVNDPATTADRRPAGDDPP